MVVKALREKKHLQRPVRLTRLPASCFVPLIPSIPRARLQESRSLAENRRPEFKRNTSSLSQP